MPKCEWCSQRATAELFVQWSVADFITYRACWDHLAAAEYLAMNTRVDDQAPQALHWTYAEEVFNTPDHWLVDDGGILW